MHTHTRTHACSHARTHARTHARMQACTHHVRTNTHIHKYACMHQARRQNLDWGVRGEGVQLVDVGGRGGGGDGESPIVQRRSSGEPPMAYNGKSLI